MTELIAGFEGLLRLGLLVVLVVGGVALLGFAWKAWLAWRRLRRVLSRDLAPGAMGSAEALAATVRLAREAQAAAGPRPGAGRQELAGLDRPGLADLAGRAFVAVHGALALGDVTPVCDRLTRDLYEGLEARCAAGPRPAALALGSAEVLAAWREGGREHATVRIGGTDAVGRARVEEWRLVRPAGAERWKVSGIVPAP